VSAADDIASRMPVAAATDFLGNSGIAAIWPRAVGAASCGGQSIFPEGGPGSDEVREPPDGANLGRYARAAASPGLVSRVSTTS
jgi:hypothetical protein